MVEERAGSRGLLLRGTRPIPWWAAATEASWRRVGNFDSVNGIDRKASASFDEHIRTYTGLTASLRVDKRLISRGGTDHFQVTATAREAVDMIVIRCCCQSLPCDLQPMVNMLSHIAL